MITTPNKVTRLAQWREQHGLTLAECADLCGYSVAHLSRVERGQRSLSARGKVRMARALDARVAELFEPMEDGYTGDIEVQP